MSDSAQGRKISPYQSPEKVSMCYIAEHDCSLSSSMCLSIAAKPLRRFAGGGSLESVASAGSTDSLSVFVAVSVESS